MADYTISFANAPGNGPMTVTAGGSVTLPAPASTNCNFLRWRDLNNKVPGLFKPGDTFTPAGDMIFKAIWCHCCGGPCLPGALFFTSAGGGQYPFRIYKVNLGDPAHPQPLTDGYYRNLVYDPKNDLIYAGQDLTSPPRPPAPLPPPPDTYAFDAETGALVAAIPGVYLGEGSIYDAVTDRIYANSAAYLGAPYELAVINPNTNTVEHSFAKLGSTNESKFPIDTAANQFYGIENNTLYIQDLTTGAETGAYDLGSANADLALDTKHRRVYFLELGYFVKLKFFDLQTHTVDPGTGERIYTKINQYDPATGYLFLQGRTGNGDVGVIIFDTNTNTIAGELPNFVMEDSGMWWSAVDDVHGLLYLYDYSAGTGSENYKIVNLKDPSFPIIGSIDVAGLTFKTVHGTALRTGTCPA